MTDDAELRGLDPFDLQDAEAARIVAHLSGLDPAGWTRPSRCEGWTVRDVLAHLDAVEQYHHACLDGKVQEFVAGLAGRGATGLDTANALGVAERAGLAPAELLEQWRRANAETRRRFRERDDGRVDTMVGDYPARWQAFHVASELATHADDMHVPVAPDERDERRAWRARFSRFALAEAKPEVEIDVTPEGTRVRGDGVDVVVDDDELIEAVAGRLGASSRLDGDARRLLSITP